MLQPCGLFHLQFSKTIHHFCMNEMLKRSSMTLAQLLTKLQKAAPTERESVVRVVTTTQELLAEGLSGRTLTQVTTKPVILCQPGEKQTLLMLGDEEETSLAENLLTGDDMPDS